LRRRKKKTETRNTRSAGKLKRPEKAGPEKEEEWRQ